MSFNYPYSKLQLSIATFFMCICNFRISAQSFIKRNCHNSGTSDDIDMKLGRVTKLQKTQTSNFKTQQHQKKLTMTSCQKIVMSLLFLEFTTNFEQSGSRISDE